MLAIQHTDYTIHGSQVAVLGLGRTGMTIARTFAALGANVKWGQEVQRIWHVSLKWGSFLFIPMS